MVFLLHVEPLVPEDDLKRKLMSCSHCQKLGQLADLASDWLLTLV